MSKIVYRLKSGSYFTCRFSRITINLIQFIKKRKCKHDVVKVPIRNIHQASLLALWCLFVNFFDPMIIHVQNRNQIL
jgi:hypothetical protein